MEHSSQPGVVGVWGGGGEGEAAKRSQTFFAFVSIR